MSDILLSDNAAIAELAQRLSLAPHIALDTEFLRERTYRPQLCLLQVAIPGEAALVDPIAAPSLAALGTVLTNAAIPKILHAARQDLEVLWPVFGSIDPVFDTQVAAALTGMPAQIGYSELVRRLLGIELNKAETRTDWSRRPLTPAQLRYAVDDVRHLAALRDLLVKRLRALGRLDWLDEELRDLANPARLFVDPETAVDRLRWIGELDPDRARLAQRLAAWRERRAAERDRPRSWILDDSGLRAMVLRPPRSANDLAAMVTATELPAGFVEHSGPEMLRIVDEAQLPARLPPPAPRARPDPENLARVKRLGAVLQQKAADLEITPEILGTRRELESLARGNQEVDMLRGWRRAVLGEALLAAV
ncbi:MAG: ribonuclease D [Pseudomonadota bacterium]